MKQLALIALAFAIFTSCEGKPANKKAVADSTTTKTVEVNYNSHYSNRLNQTARIIAGISTPTDSMFQSVRRSVVWQKYATASDTVWAAYDKRNTNLYNWVKAEVQPKTDSLRNVFYPLSGPDFLYGNLMFPNAETIYMFGLEEIGSVPDFDKISPAQIEEYVTFYKRSISEVLKDSFYHTKGMKVYLDNANVDGVTPILMLFLTKRGKQISEVNHLTLNADGSIKVVPNDAKFKKLQNRGVEIKYFNGTDNIERKLYFFTGNIADGALNTENPAYKKYYSSIRFDGTFIKSATYLLHKDYFSHIRNVILKNSSIVVSDDSGIAFKFYDPKVWNVQLYGTYTKPIALFDNLYEPDLYQAYRDPKRTIKSINFRIGYSSPSNIRIVTRK